MGLSADDYLQQAQALMPPGPAWPRDVDAYVTRLMLALSAEFARADMRAIALLDEADPRTTSDLLLDWERVAGLPDGCIVDAGEEPSTEQRRAALLARLTMLGSQSPSYYVALAASLGYVITITEFDAHDVDDDVDKPIYDDDWMHAWQVNAALHQVVELDVESSVDDALAAWSNVALECVLNRFKPAHTLLIFAYT